jgi:Phage P2 baseplate assembly protein gpV
MSKDPVKGTRRLRSGNTLPNAIDLAIEQKSRDLINTAELVSISSADQSGTGAPVGKATVTPCVGQTDNFGKMIDPVAFPKGNIWRMQAGKAAIVMNPQPGDKGLAVFTKRDSSSVTKDTKEPVAPASHRIFDVGDAFIIPGFHNDTPDYWLSIDPASGNIDLSTKGAAVKIECRDSGDISIQTAAGNFEIKATQAKHDVPEVTFTGNVTIEGNLTIGGGLSVGGTVAGPLNMTGGLKNTGGSIESNTITLETHNHSGVSPGGSNTNSPNENT